MVNVADATLPKDTFWHRMEFARIKKGYSHRELENLMGLGRGYYRNYEKISMGIRAETLVLFCKLTDASISFVVYGEGSPYPVIELKADTVGARIRELRQMHGLSQREFAARIGYERNTANVLLWEKNRHAIKVESLLRITNAFRISIESLLKNVGY